MRVSISTASFDFSLQTIHFSSSSAIKYSDPRASPVCFWLLSGAKWNIYQLVSSDPDNDDKCSSLFLVWSELACCQVASSFQRLMNYLLRCVLASISKHGRRALRFLAAATAKRRNYFNFSQKRTRTTSQPWSSQFVKIIFLESGYEKHFLPRHK